ncbi:LppX_LprAFG lipoprotein [Streptomyces sp. NPDC001508]|uniref:LppX_LprAFG lipoprotein n=1 Tax=Streptomyces sp. NPDC001508 TaxID=3154656 RepID=UPI00332CBDCA
MRSSVGVTGIAVLLLAGGAVGCGAKDDAAKSPAMEPAAAVAAAAKNADGITSFRYRLTGSVPGEGKIKGEAAMSVKPLAMSMKMAVEDKATDGQVEIRLIDKAMYIGGNAEMAKEMDGKSWIKFDMSALGGDSGRAMDQLGAGEAGKNPAADSTFLTGSKDVKKVGTETVDGVETTHYKGTVSLDDLRTTLKDKDKEARERRETSIEQYEKMGLDSMTMDMWIDGEHHTKQFRMRGDAQKGPLDMTITFLDYNKPVKVTAPPAKDTADLAEMMKAAEQA